MAIKFETHIPEKDDSFDTPWRSYRDDDFGKNLSGDIESIALDQQKDGSPYKINIVINGQKRDPDKIASEVAALLQTTGTEIDSESYGGSSSRKVSVSGNLDSGSLIRAVMALSTEVSIGEEKFYPKLGTGVVNQIIAQELKLLEKTPEDLGLMHCEVTQMDTQRQKAYGLSEPISTLDATITFPHSAIDLVREENQWTSVEGRHAMQMHTRLGLKGGHNFDTIENALRTAGIEFDSHPEHRNINVKASGDVVMQALATHPEVMPGFLREAIAQQALAAHPNQNAVDKVINAQPLPNSSYAGKKPQRGGRS